MNRFPVENIDKVEEATSADLANKATQLETSRTISLTGGVTGTASFDGTGDASIAAIIADDSHNHVIANIDELQNILDGKCNSKVTYYPVTDTQHPDEILDSTFLIGGSKAGLSGENFVYITQLFYQKGIDGNRKQIAYGYSTNNLYTRYFYNDVWSEWEKMTSSAATAAPKAPGTAAVGTSDKYAREDHVHPAQTSVNTAINDEDGNPLVSYLRTVSSGTGSIIFRTGAGNETVVNITTSSAGKLTTARKITLPAAYTPSNITSDTYVLFDGAADVRFGCSGCSGCTSCTGTCTGTCTRCSGSCNTCSSCSSSCSGGCTSSGTNSRGDAT